MADPYIDRIETQIYGLFAREQMQTVCIGKVPELDAMVAFAIAAQTKADAAMKVVLDQQPIVAPVDSTAVLETARDTIRRFGAYIDSLKGQPLDTKDYFGNEVPSVVARRRLLKLTAAAKHMHDTLVKQQAKAPGTADWIADLAQTHTDLAALEKNQRAVKVEKVDLAPDVAAERLRWLAVYNANKLLIRGLLEHAGKVELMPLIFDDLAEIHRVAGVSDEDAPGTAETKSTGGTAPAPEKTAAPATPAAPATSTTTPATPPPATKTPA